MSKVSFEDGGYIGLVGFEVGVGLERSRFWCALDFSAADTPIRACRCFATAQCDLFRLDEAGRGAAQSKATVRAPKGPEPG